jgi:AraC-like DNA-binding protein
MRERHVMIFATHVPGPPLAEFVERLWFYDDLIAPHPRERVLPDGTFELIINLADQPRKVFPRDALRAPQEYRRSWISGAHSEFIVIDVIARAALMGAHFHPGGASQVLGFPADELRDRVVELEDLWGSDARYLREALLEATAPQAKFQILERHLTRRMRSRGPPDRTVAHALRRFHMEPHVATIDEAAHLAGVSHKHLIAKFREVVGLTPKVFCRIGRFQKVLRTIHRQETVGWAEVAAACGYYDQSHFIQDFRRFSGLNPTAYLRERGDNLNFVPVYGEAPS